MNNKELISELAYRLGYTHKDAAQLVTSMVHFMEEELQKDKVLDFEDFGTFEVKKKMERIMVNPATKQRLLLPPKLVLNFRPDKALKEKFKKTVDDE